MPRVIPMAAAPTTIRVEGCERSDWWNIAMAGLRRGRFFFLNPLEHRSCVPPNRPWRNWTSRSDQ